MCYIFTLLIVWTNCYGVCVAVQLKFASDGLDMAQTVSSHVFIDLFFLGLTVVSLLNTK